MSESFDNRKQRAIDELLKMNQTAPKVEPPQKPSPTFSGIDIPILNKLKSDSDLTLILGLLLLLLNENADKRLLFALLYILL